MQRFFIMAHGDSFDVDAYLSVSTLVIDQIWRLGDFPTPTCGIRIWFGGDHSLPPATQEQNAIAYLQAHRDELKSLGQFPGVETFILGMNEAIEGVCESLKGFTLEMSATMMWHALEIGIRPVFYVELLHLRDDGSSSDAEGL